MNVHQLINCLLCRVRTDFSIVCVARIFVKIIMQSVKHGYRETHDKGHVCSTSCNSSFNVINRREVLIGDWAIFVE